MNSKFNNRIVISIKTYAKDAAGGDIESWANFGEFWANFKFKYELVIKQGEIRRIHNIYLVKMRYKSDIKRGMRVCYQNKICYISKIISVDQKNSIVFEVMQKVEN